MAPGRHWRPFFVAGKTGGGRLPETQGNGPPEWTGSQPLRVSGCRFSGAAWFIREGETPPGRLWQLKIQLASRMGAVLKVNHELGKIPAHGIRGSGNECERFAQFFWSGIQCDSLIGDLII